MNAPDGRVENIPGSHGEKYYTIQRVNGNGGNGKGDGVAGPHKHTLEESDRVKKNSIQRQSLKEEKVKKKSQVSVLHCSHLHIFLPHYLRECTNYQLLSSHRLSEKCSCSFVYPSLHSRSPSAMYLYAKPDRSSSRRPSTSSFDQHPHSAITNILYDFGVKTAR